MIGGSERIRMTILNIMYRLMSRYLRLSLFVGRGMREGMIGKITSNGLLCINGVVVKVATFWSKFPGSILGVTFFLLQEGQLGCILACPMAP